MIIGFDFDNTIVSYDELFHRVACERGLIPAGTAPVKNAIRDYLRACNREIEWTNLQGYVYGSGIVGATAFPGIAEYFSALLMNNHEVFVVSHKTKHPYEGEQFDLHSSARTWLESNGFFALGLKSENVFFELTKESKLKRIGMLSCDVFFDDLPEFLGEPEFPSASRKVLFDPNGIHAGESRFDRISSWRDSVQLSRFIK